MALRLRDRVRQKTTTTGTGTLTLGSAVSAFSTFADRLSDGDLTYYTISNATQYEVGSGVYFGGTLSRDTVFSSSNSDQRINLSVESDVFITYPSDKSVHLSEDRVITGVQAIDWVLNGTPEYLEGRVFYDNINHALAVFNDEPDITLQVGQENYIRVRNNTGATITNGQAVKILGAQGTNTTVELAIATDAIKSQAVGLATHDIEHNSFGYVTTFGSVNDLDTSDFNDGDEIFLSPVISGGLTGVSPTAPDYVVSLGHVIRSHPAVGNILVQPGFPKLGGGDVKSLGDKVASGVAFTAQIAGTDAAIIASTTGLIYDSGNSILRVDAGGIRFPDGNTQTIAYTGQVGADPTGVVSGVAFFNSNDNTISSYTGLVYNSGDNRFILKDIGARFEVRDNAGQRTLVLGDNSTAGTTNVGYISFHVNDEEIGDIRANANGLMVRTQQNTRDLLIRNSDNTIIAKFAGGSQDYELFLEPHDATKVGQIIQGAVSQTANLQEWQDSSQNVLASVDYKGTVSGSGYTFPDGVTQTIAYTGQEADLSSYATISYVDSVSGNLQAEIDTNGVIIGFLQNQITSNDTDISNLQTATGLLETRVTQNELDITALENATGNLDTRVTQNTNDITSVSGLLYNNWNINVTGNVDSITSNENVVFTGVGLTSVSYDSSTNTVSISGSADGDTTYTAGSGLALDGDEFNVYGGTGLLDALYFPADGSGVGINITLSPSRFASQIPGNGSQPRILVGFGNDQYPIYEELDGTVVVGHFNNSGAIGRPDGNLVFGNGCLRLSSGCYENRIFGKSNMTSSSNSHSNVIVGFNSAFGLTDTSSAYIISSNQGANNASNIDSTVVIGQQNALNATDFTESVSIGGGASVEASGDKNLILGYAAGYQIAGDNNIDIHNNPSFLNIIGSNSNKLNIGSTIVGDTSSKLLAIGNVGASDITPDATLEIKPNASTDVGLIVQAAASHTANLQEWQDSSENVLAYVDPSGAISGADIFTEQLEVNLASPSDIGVTVQGVASQTANLQEWKNSVGSGAYIDNSGNFVFQSYNDTTRPAAGVAGRVIFNTDDGNLNIDNGTNWIHPSGGTT